MTYPRNARLTESEWAEYKSLIQGHYATGGHDLDCALAMLSQSNLRHPASPITPTQVLHLLQIGYTAGWAVGKKVLAEAKDTNHTWSGLGPCDVCAPTTGHNEVTA